MLMLIQHKRGHPAQSVLDNVEWGQLSDLSSPLLSSLIFFKKHPLFEACDGKRERLKQSASKLACQKALNQYPSSLPTQPCSPFTPPPPLSDPAVPPFLRLFPFFCLHFLLHSCTLAPLLSCPSPFSFAHFKSYPLSSSKPLLFFLTQLTDREKGQSLQREMDGCIGRERRMQGEVDSDQVDMVGLFQKERLWKKKRASADVFVLKERESSPLSPMGVEEMEKRRQRGR